MPKFLQELEIEQIHLENQMRDLQALNRDLTDELEKTRTAIKNGLELGYIYKCDCSHEWLKRVEEVLEKAKGIE